MARNSSQTSQNVDNFIKDRSSTRLHKPPGGASTAGSLIYGGADDQADDSRISKRRSQASIISGLKSDAPEIDNNNRKKDELKTNCPEQSNNHENKASSKITSSNAYASGGNQNTGNGITDRRMTRIHAPPGGASSFSIGWN